MQSNRRTVILLAGLAAVFACGIGHLFMLRYRAGDIYPVYSSLRADPLGTKAFYEGLARCEKISVERSYKDIARLDLDSDTTVLWLGDTIRRGELIDGDTIGVINGFVRRGGRVVFAFLPTSRREFKKAIQIPPPATGGATNVVRRARARSDKAPPPT